MPKFAMVMPNSWQHGVAEGLYWIQLVSSQSGLAYTSQGPVSSGNIAQWANVPNGTYQAYFSPYAAGPFAQLAGLDGIKVSDMVSGNPWFDVVAYGADATGATDTTSAIQTALNAVPTGGGVVFFPAGTYLVSSSLTPKTNTIILGSGRNTSILKGTAGFVAGAANSGLINYIGSGTTVFAYCEIRQLGFDISNVTDIQATCVHQDRFNVTGSAMQHCIFDDLAFELGTQTSHIGLQLEGLGSTNTVASFDIQIRNIYGHNGRGDVTCYLNGTAATATYYDVKVENVYAVVDQAVLDDRVAIVAHAPGALSNAEIHDITVQGVYVFIAAGLATSTINGTKLDCGQNGYIHGVTIRDNYMFNLSPANATATPVVFFLTGATSQLEDVEIDGVFGYQTGRLQIRVARNRQAPLLSIQNVQLTRSTDTIAGIEVYCASVAVGDEQLVIRNVSLDNNATQGANIPVGIMLTGGSSTQGWSGLCLISGVFVNNYKQVVSNNVIEAGTIALSGWSNIAVENLAYNAVSAVFSIGAGTVYSTKYHQGSGAEVFDTTQAIQIGNTLTSSVTIGPNGGIQVDSKGHLISAATGTPTITNLGANVTSVTPTGNDTRGKLVIVMAGALAANTRIATVTFANSYGATGPVVVLVNQTAGAGLGIVNFYKSASSTGVSFDFAADQALALGTYEAEYVVLG